MNNNEYLRGSICLSDIPKELITTHVCKDGVERKYLSIAVMARRTPKSYQNEHGERTITHYITCAPPKEQQKDGVNYFIADLETKQFHQNAGAAPAMGDMAPQFGNASDLPF